MKKLFFYFLLFVITSILFKACAITLQIKNALGDKAKIHYTYTSPGGQKTKSFKELENGKSLELTEEQLLGPDKVGIYSVEWEYLRSIPESSTIVEAVPKEYVMGFLYIKPSKKQNEVIVTNPKQSYEFNAPKENKILVTLLPDKKISDEKCDETNCVPAVYDVNRFTAELSK